MSDIIGTNEPLIKIQCNNCTHYNRENPNTASCAAFKIIPDDILNGDNKHLTPTKTQSNNIVFDPIIKTNRD